MKIRLLLFSCLVALVVGAAGCRRCTVARTYSFMEKTKGYFLDFKDGDRWVYERVDDSVHLDTFVFTDKKRQHNYETTENDCDGDYYEAQTHLLVNPATGDTLRGYAKAATQADHYSLSGMLAGNGFSFYSPYVQRSSQELECHPEDKITVHPAYTVKGKSYTHVLEFKIAAGYTNFPDKISVFFWAPATGLIYFERYHSGKQRRVAYSLVEYLPAP